MKLNPVVLASPRQVKYIDDLFNHLGWQPSQKRAYIQDGYGGKKYPDELTVAQASQLINILEEKRAQEFSDQRNGKLEL